MQEACGESRSRDTEAPDCLDIIEKSAKQKAMRNERNIKTEALISFSERAGLWVVRIPRRRGGYKLLDYYDSEEEAVEAKDAYFRELESDGSES